MDPATLAIGAAVGGGVGTLAAVVIAGLIVRWTYRTWREFDGIRSTALEEMREQNAELRGRIQRLERMERDAARTRDDGPIGADSPEGRGDR